MTFNAKKLAAGLLMTTVATSSLLSFNAMALGQTGHRVVGQICQNHLNIKAWSAVSAIMDGEQLAFAATWPDEMRSSRDNTNFWGRIASNWHYVNVPAGQSYQTSIKAPQGDVIVALEAFIDILEDKKLVDGPIKKGLNELFGDIEAEKNERALKQLAIRFILHLVGDLHQPLHAGHKSDRGGNNIKVMWFEEAKKLHGIWDTELIDNQNLSFSELTKKLDRLSKQEQQAITESNIMDWLDESLVLRKSVYDVQQYNYDLSYSYIFDNTPLINSQLQKAGLRAAKILNTIYK